MLKDQGLIQEAINHSEVGVTRCSVGGQIGQIPEADLEVPNPLNILLDRQPSGLGLDHESGSKVQTVCRSESW